MNRLTVRDLLNVLHDAVVADHVVRQAELFSLEARCATASKFALVVGRAVSRVKRFELHLALLAALRDTDCAVGGFVRFDSLPLEVVSRAGSRDEVNWTFFRAAARRCIIVATVRRTCSRLQHMDLL